MLVLQLPHSVKSKMLLLLLALLVAVCVDGGKVQLPSYLEKCTRSDSDCFAKNFAVAMDNLKNGDAKLGVPVLEPLHLEQLEFSMGQSNGPVSLSQKYTNINFYGSTILTITNMTVDMTGTNCMWTFTEHAANYTMIGDYELNGQILLLPINSRGKCRFVLMGVDCSFKLKCERYTNEKGKKRIRITDLDMEYTHLDDIDLYFSNLIEGNEQMSGELLKTLNENGMMIFNEVKGGVGDGLVQLYKTAMNNFLAKFSEDELFKD